MEKINLAIIGCGAVVRRHHMPVLSRNPYINVSALCDKNEGAAQLVQSRFGLKCCILRDIQDVLALPDINAVIISTPGPTHYDLALTSLNAGKNVLIEKPPVIRAEEAENLHNIASEKNLKIGVIFNNRYRKEIKLLRDYIHRGLIGKITKIQATHHANFVFAEAPWLWDQKKSMYLVYEFGIHLFDLLIYLLGEYSKIEYLIPFNNPEINQTTEIQVGITFKAGTFAHVVISQDSLRHSTYKTVIDVYGTAMDAHIRYFPPQVRLSAGIEHPVGLLWSEIRSLSSLAFLLITRRWNETRNCGHYLLLNEFIDWIRGYSNYSLPIKEVIPTVKLLYDIAKRIPNYELGGSNKIRNES